MRRPCTMASVSATISSCKLLREIGAARGDEGACRPFLVLGVDLRQMLQQGMDEPPAGIAAILAQSERA